MRIKIFLFLIISIVLTAGAAQATRITLDNAKSVDLIFDQGTETGKTDMAGEFIISSDDSSLAPFGYCVQQPVPIWKGYTYSVVSLNDVSGKYINVAWLVDTYQPIITEDYQTAALQLAIWDILDDGGDLLLDDISNIVPADVQDYFDIIKAGYNAATDKTSVIGKGYKIAELVFETSDGEFDVQDIIVRSVPEPATMMLFGFGLLGLGLLARRKS